MDGISLPTSIIIDTVPEDGNRATMTVSPCYPGYGTTLGNALRRVLLSSLPGAAITAFKVKSVDHEFSTLPHVKEDVVEMILNIKTLRFHLEGDDLVELELDAKGEGPVTASQFKKKSGVTIANPDAVIATITDKAGGLHLKVIVQRGRGYVPVETREKEKRDVGYIAVDSIYTPVRNVNFRTEHIRVGQMTNYDKLLLDITTDGTMSPEEAFRQAVQILVEQFQGLLAPANQEQETTTAGEGTDESPNDEESDEDVVAEEDSTEADGTKEKKAEPHAQEEQAESEE